MAVSNSIGSNVFDILVGLALPWFVETAIVHPGISINNIISNQLFIQFIFKEPLHRLTVKDLSMPSYYYFCHF